ncbi:MAG: hypothetical protein KTR22_06530 [Flavobacteriaceae bacterium]|nr:hypothetical protein [Flavobacteriaceae bacterium]
MKKTVYFLWISMGLFALGCSQDDALENELNADLQSSSVPANEQTALARYDQQEKGLYHGLFLAKFSQNRGKIWVNVGNDGTYTAEVVLHHGEVIHYERVLSKSTNPIEDDKAVFHFTSSNKSSFTLDVTDYKNPLILNAKLDDALFHGVIRKQTSQIVPTVAMGTYDDGAGFSGTWNFIADGTNPNPNGTSAGAEGLTHIITTHSGNGAMYMDLGPFEVSLGCLGEPVPILKDFGFTILVAAADQMSNFSPSSSTVWSLEGLGTFFQSYSDTNNACAAVTGGTFVHQWNGNVYTGNILID